MWRSPAPTTCSRHARSSPPHALVVATVPVGYEMPKPKTEGSPPGMTGDAPEEAHMRIAFSAGTDYFNTGKMGDQWGSGIPLPVTRELMERGQQRFNITCAMCHGASAAGNRYEEWGSHP